LLGTGAARLTTRADGQPARPARAVHAPRQSRPRGAGVAVEAAGRRPRRDAALATASPSSLPRVPAMRVRAPGHRWGASLARRGELGGGRARDEACTCSRPDACSRQRGRRVRPSCGGRARVTVSAGGGEPRACSQSTTSSPAKAGAVKWSTRARSTRGSGGWLELTHVDGRCARWFDAPDAAAGRGHGLKSEYYFSADAGRGPEQAPGWPCWDGLEQAVARPARGAVRGRRLVSLTSTSTARGMEDIVRHCHGHREIITDASVVELRFHSRGSFPLEQLEIKAWRGGIKDGPARRGPDTHRTADPSIRR
jgi:hypothetical protein